MRSTSRARLRHDQSVDTKWWGFEIHLDAQVVNKVSEYSPLIGHFVGALLPDPIDTIGEAYCEVKAAWIKEVGKDYGCKLVSPWGAPGMLI
ncbi:hypothetical protein [Streptomyces sp. NPDC007205]|uniref:hypothetical protein n=1 Tax=Streptomyces sp. NPDC007205 TaxID=3154316 RepID=UPI0033DA8D84